MTNDHDPMLGDLRRRAPKTKTSALRHIEENGVAATMRDRVLTLLRAYPDGLTCNEIAAKLSTGKRPVHPNDITGRLDELLEAKAVLWIGRRRSEVSGLRNKVWRIRTPGDLRAPGKQVSFDDGAWTA